MLLVLIQSKFAHLRSFPWGPRYSRVKLVKALDTFFMHACPYKLARLNFPSKHLTSNFQAGDDLFARAKRGDPDAKKILKEQMLEIFDDALPDIDKIITKRANEKIGDLKTGLTAPEALERRQPKITTNRRSSRLLKICATISTTRSSEGRSAMAGSRPSKPPTTRSSTRSSKTIRIGSGNSTATEGEIFIYFHWLRGTVVAFVLSFGCS